MSGLTNMKVRHPQVENFPSHNGPDYKTAISEGRFDGYNLINKFAYCNDVDVGPFRVLSNNMDIVHWITDERQMKVVAANAADCITGTGVRAVLIEYLNEACELKTEYLELEADQSTNTVATDIFRVESLTAVKYGSSGSLNGATGAITLENLAGTETYSEIAQYKTHSEVCIHWIRPNYRSVFSEVEIESVTEAAGVYVGIFGTFDYSAYGGDTNVSVQCCGVGASWGNIAVIAIDPHFGLFNASDEIQAVYFAAKSKSETSNLQASASFVLYEFENKHEA